MSFNITVDVDEEGNAKFQEDSSYTKTAKPGRYVISGHFVPEGESGSEWIAATGPGGLTANGGHSVQASTPQQV